MTDHPPANLHTRAWRVLTADTSEEEAAALFARRFGQPPEYIFDYGAYLYAGPVPETKSLEAHP
jgi:hypothetical protein